MHIHTATAVTAYVFLTSDQNSHFTVLHIWPSLIQTLKYYVHAVCLAQMYELSCTDSLHPFVMKNAAYHTLCIWNLCFTTDWYCSLHKPITTLYTIYCGFVYL